MIKVVILLGILGLSSYIGFVGSNTYRQKLTFYEDILSFCKTLKNDISFLKEDILTVVSKQQYKSFLKQILDDFCQMLKNSENASKVQINDLLSKYSLLTEQDKNLLTEFLGNLGKLSFDEQIYSIEYYINTFNDLFNRQNESNAKMIPFCNKIGILIGLVICIVLI